MSRTAFLKNRSVEIDVPGAVRQYRKITSILRRDRPMLEDTRAHYEGKLREIELSLLLADHMELVARVVEEGRITDLAARDRRRGRIDERRLALIARKRADIVRLLEV